VVGVILLLAILFIPVFVYWAWLVVAAVLLASSTDQAVPA
jgi:hypothetical protein